MKTKSNITAQAWVEEHGHKYTDRRKLFHACQKATGKSRSGVNAAIAAIWCGKPGTTKVPKPAPSADDIIPADDLLRALDVPKMILEELDEVGDAYIEESKLQRRINCSRQQWREAVSKSIFKDHRIVINDHTNNNRRMTIWSSKRGIKAARNTLSMGRYDDA